MLKKLVVSLVIASFLAACGSSVESQTKKWEQAQKLKTELGQKWPNYKGPIEQNFAPALALWNEAQNLKKEDAKIEKMKTANEKANDLLNPLRQVRDRLAEVNKQISKINSKRIPKSMSNRRSTVVSQANSTVSEVNTLMMNPPGATLEDIKTNAKSCVSKLISASGALKRFEKSLKGKKSKKKKKKAS